jgi:hypothetical protein
MSAVFKMDRDTLQCAWYWGLTMELSRHQRLHRSNDERF